MMNCPISLKHLLTANMQLGFGCCEIAAARMFVVSSVGRSEKDDIGGCRGSLSVQNRERDNQRTRNPDKKGCECMLTPSISIGLKAERKSAP